MKRKILSSLLIILIFISTTYAKITELPDLGNPSSQTITLAEENKLGKEFMQQVQQNIPLVKDPIVENYIQNLGNKLVANTRAGDREFHFFVVKDASINAFAGPGGYIGVHSGLIMLAENESELAGVIAHEIAHVTQRHIARTFEKAKGLNWATAAAIIGSIALGTVSGQLGSGALMATLGGIQQGMINFTRSNEQEADRVSIETLYGTNFNPDSMAIFFQRMQRTDYSGVQLPEFLQTHPLYTSRISDAQNLTANLPKKDYQNSLEFHLIKERLRVDLSSNAKALLNSYTVALKKVKGTQRTVFDYGYALALSKNHQFSEARKIILKLREQNKWQIQYILALAENDLKSNQVKTGLKLYQDYHEFYPDYYPLTIMYADALRKHGKAKKAISIYLDAIRANPDNPELYSKLSRAYADSGNTFEAYFARARAYQLLGNYHLAIQQVTQAKKHVNNSSYKKIRIEAKLKELMTAYENQD